MDGHSKDLIVQLCTRAAMIMEDVSPLALGIGTRDPAATVVALQDLARAGDTIAALVRAARLLAGHPN